MISLHYQALSLLDEVRNGLCNMLLPNQHRIKQAIMEKLDIDLIRQQAENGALNFQGKSCRMFVKVLQSKKLFDEYIEALDSK